MTEENRVLIDQYVREIGETGSKTALGNLFKLTYGPLCRILGRSYKNHHDVEEIVMLTYDRIVEKSPTLLFFKNCYKWIIKLAIGELRNHQRKKKNRSDILHSMSIPTHLKMNEDKILLIVEIKKLTPHQQGIIIYKYYCKLKIDEIALIMKSSRATIFRQINVIRKILKEKLS